MGPYPHVKQYHRRSIRLPNQDYALNGVYFITICTHNRECVFGEIQNGHMVLNEFGRIIELEWLRTSKIRPYVLLDEYVVMPNHFHGILIITSVGATGRSPLQIHVNGPPKRSLGAIMAGFKSAVTVRMNELRNTPHRRVWQRSYYEHVIRNERSLGRIREYIRNNPMMWDRDPDNPNRI